MDTLADAVASPASADNGSLPYGRSHWDSKPAEVHAMILKAAGPLTLFINGLLGDEDSLDEATVEALWTDVISIDWQGDLALLPDVYLKVGKAISRKRPVLDMLSLSVSRSMYSRLCTRFPNQATINRNFDQQYDRYLSNFQHTLDHFDATRLHHIPMRNGWFDLVDFSYPISLGWIAISFGHAALLSHLAEHHGVDLAKFQSLNGRLAMDIAAQKGHVDVLQMLHDAGNTSNSDIDIDEAAAGGHLDVVKWLHANRTEGCTTNAMDWAAENGHLHVVKWLHANRTEGCTPKAIDRAASCGHLHVVRWLHANRTEGCTTMAMNCAARKGHLHVVIWLHKNRTEGCTAHAMCFAAGEGHLDVVIWLHENRTEGCSTEAMDSAADGGHLEVVRWLHANRTEGCTTDAIDYAAMNGHVEVVQFLLVCGYEFTFYALCEAKDDAIVDALVDSMTLERAKEMLRRARAEYGCAELIERLKRAVADKQASE